jgi:hypothetical protein
LTAAALLLFLSLAAACREPHMASPGGSGIQITGVQPSILVAAAGVQTITVQGQDFLPGLTLDVVAPGGATQNFVGTSIQGLTTSSFRVQPLFDVPGTYSFVVRNSAGVAAEPFPVQVRDPSNTTAPIMTSVNPAVLSPSPAAQTVSITGTNFATGLSVRITQPDGTISIASAGEVSNVTTTGFQLRLVFSRTGFYLLQVNNPNGEVSNSLTVTVQP